MKVAAAVASLLYAQSVSAQDMSFSMYGVKSGKGMGYSKASKGFGTKSAKGSGSDISGKSGKSKSMKFDTCVFENPILNFYFFDYYIEESRVDSSSSMTLNPEYSANFGDESVESFKPGGDDFVYFLLEHQAWVNEIFAYALEEYIDYGATPEDIWEFGEFLLNAHPWWIVKKLKYKCEIFCAMLHQMVHQMDGTCNQNKYMKAYVNVAANLFSGFMNGYYESGHGHGHRVEELGGHGPRPDYNILWCPDFEYYVGASYYQSFEDEFEDYLTKATIDNVDFGVYCEPDIEDEIPDAQDAAGLEKETLEAVGSIGSL